MDVNEQMAALAAAFTAMGDENRQLIILALLRHSGGMRVGELMEEVRLSRPALSHHLRILKEAGIVDMFKIGTKNYYHLSGDKKNWDRFTVLMRQIEALMAQGNKDCSQRKELEEDERHRGDGGPAFRPELSE